MKSQKKKIEGTKSIDILSEKISDTTTQVSQQEANPELNESTSDSKKVSSTSSIEVRKENIIPILTESENN